MSNITVYCGSNKGINPIYEAKAKALGIEMARNNYGLIFGAGNVGLMGVIADEMLAIGAEVIGIIPQHLVDAEVCHSQLTKLIVTDTMHERKALMADDTDAFIAMPGGIGTLEEIIEIMTWAQIGLHKKAIALYNINGFYDHLIEYMYHMIEEGFLQKAQMDLLIIEDDPKVLIQKIKAYKSSYIPKWLQK